MRTILLILAILAMAGVSHGYDLAKEDGFAYSGTAQYEYKLSETEIARAIVEYLERRGVDVPAGGLSFYYIDGYNRSSDGRGWVTITHEIPMAVPQEPLPGKSLTGGKERLSPFHGHR